MDTNAIRIDILKDLLWEEQNITLGMLRLDLLHPEVSGNKWFKLFKNAAYLQAHDFSSLLTFGGAFSNHLHATAHYCKLNQIPCIGIVRGDELNINSNFTLWDCHHAGMELYFVNRKEYNQFEHGATAKRLAKEKNALVVEQGGDNEWGYLGAQKITEWIDNTWTDIAVSVGTGTTLGGIIQKLTHAQRMMGFSSLYHNEEVLQRIVQLTGRNDFDFFTEFHFGGFGKKDTELKEFMIAFKQQHGIVLDVVYTAKMMYGIYALLQRNYFPKGSKILCVHTGGVQGNRSDLDLAKL